MRGMRERGHPFLRTGTVHTYPRSHFEHKLISPGTDSDGSLNGRMLSGDALKVDSLNPIGTGPLYYFRRESHFAAPRTWARTRFRARDIVERNPK